MSFSPREFIYLNFIERPELREKVTRAVYGDKDVVRKVCGVDLDINTLRENGYLRAAKAASMSSVLGDEVITLQRLAMFFSDDVTFVDAGANIGLFSSLAAGAGNIFRNFAVHAFEPHPGTYSRLKRNAARHGFEAHECGLGAKAEQTSFVEGAVSHVTTRADAPNVYSIEGRNIDVTIKRLDDFDLAGDLVIKIDVEGQELAVLEGAMRYFDEGRVRTVFVDGYEDPGVWKFLEDRGFRMLDCETLLPAKDKTFHLLAVRDDKQ